MKSHCILYLLISLAVLALSCESSRQSTITTPGNIEAQIDEIFAEFDNLKRPGAAVAVTKNGEIVFEKGYGAANLEYDIPVSSSTVFHIASVSKQFTVFSILLLQEEGKLNFDDDIRKYIPEVPDFGKTITLRHLASHTSGMRDQWNLLTMAGWRMDDVITKEHVLKLVAKQEELNFDPGEEYAYCNTGFTLLAEVVARASGQSFAEFTKDKIFDPLQMEHTLFYDDHEKIVNNRAYSYYPEDEGYKKSVLNYANVGATSLFTTVHDLSLWAVNFEQLKVGSIELIDEMNTPATLNNGSTFGGAYGQFVGNHNGHTEIQHGGADAGYRTYLTRFPEAGVTVTVFSNYANSNPVALSYEVADLFLPVVEEDVNIEEPTSSVQDFISLTPDELKSFEGNYWNEVDSYSRRIYVDNDTLIYSRGGSDTSPLIPVSSNTFQMLNVGVDLKVSFFSEDNQETMVVTIDGSPPIKSVKYIRKSFIEDDLRVYSGQFYSPELSTTYTLVAENDHLIATHPRQSDITLTPVRDNVFTGDQWYFGNVEFDRSNTGEVTGMRVSSGRVRNLKFGKVFQE